jgi:hypothetical protein
VETSKRRNRKRFLYPAGAISLFLLPVFCIYYLFKQNAFEIPRALEIVWWSEAWGEHSKEINSYSIYPARKYMHFILSANDTENVIVLDSARLAIRDLISTQDTVKGIHFHFDDKSNYWTFIRAVDICKIEKAKLFVPAGNDLWVFNLPPRPQPTGREVTGWICGTIALAPTEEQYQDELAIENQVKLNYALEQAKRFWLPILLFILLVVLAIRKLTGNRL